MMTVMMILMVMTMMILMVMTMMILMVMIMVAGENMIIAMRARTQLQTNAQRSQNGHQAGIQTDPELSALQPRVSERSFGGTVNLLTLTLNPTPLNPNPLKP